jgi:hypothetical protein
MIIDYCNLKALDMNPLPFDFGKKDILVKNLNETIYNSVAADLIIS